jgi:very-short-patch-repair endonuclease
VDLTAAVTRLGGLATRADLLEAGALPHQLTAAVRSGMLLRVRRAWYAIPDAPFDRRIAVAMGGRLGSVSALRSYGVWVRADDAVHVSWNPHGNVARPGRRLGYPARSQFGAVRVVSHWRRLEERLGPQDPWRESPEQALAQALRSEPPPFALAALDSALHRGLISPEQLPWIAHGLPRSANQLVALSNASADSGIESIARYQLAAEDVPFVVHPVLHGLEVDLLVGRSLVIETDGAEFHAGIAAFERDRHRDATLAAHGYIVARFSYRQVIDAWPECRARIRAHLAHGDHLRVVS